MQFNQLILVDERDTIIKESPINFSDVLLVLDEVPNLWQTYPLLAGIDPYGDTIFNRLQVEHLIVELRVLRGIIKDENVSEL